MDSQYQSYQDFLQKVFGKRDDLLPLRPKDITMIHEILVKRLTSRESEVIQMRFGLNEEGKKYVFREIGERFDVCGETIRYVCTKAIRKLRHPQNSREIRWLFRVTLERDFAEAREELAKARLENDELKYWGVIAKDLRAKANLDTSISDLNLSIRSFNCLTRIEVTTVRELVKLREDQLMGLQNFGARSMKEVKDKLAQLGLQLTKTM
ncbi:MAG: DNA-directed RNA polymerase subunit alpha C-terminal domain-containing protein [Weeksellaceae bacterium]|nr:DNA-directed RNA polymerase subunit alpha C-terminal domain-containing protein [Weeksellaceae bacterium]